MATLGRKRVRSTHDSNRLQQRARTGPTTDPGRAPVSIPLATTAVPLTKTYSMPVGYRAGSPGEDLSCN